MKAEISKDMKTNLGMVIKQLYNIGIRGFNPVQQGIILRGIDAGLDTSKYCDPSYPAEDMAKDTIEGIKDLLCAQYGVPNGADITALFETQVKVLEDPHLGVPRSKENLDKMIAIFCLYSQARISAESGVNRTYVCRYKDLAYSRWISYEICKYRDLGLPDDILKKIQKIYERHQRAHRNRTKFSPDYKFADCIKNTLNEVDELLNPGKSSRIPVGAVLSYRGASHNETLALTWGDNLGSTSCSYSE